MTWPAKNDAVVKTKINHRVQVLDRGADEPGLEYGVPASYWQSRRGKRKQSFDNSDYERAPPSKSSEFIPPDNSEMERIITRSPVAVTKLRQKSQSSILSQHRKDPIPPIAPSANRELAGASRRDVITDARLPTVWSTLSNVQGQAQESDDDLLILDQAPPSWKTQNKIKEEAVTIKKEPLAVKVRFLF